MPVLKQHHPAVSGDLCGLKAFVSLRVSGDFEINISNNSRSISIAQLSKQFDVKCLRFSCCKIIGNTNDAKDTAKKPHESNVFKALTAGRKSREIKQVCS